MEAPQGLTQLSNQGWVVFPGLFDADTCARLRSAIVSVWHDRGRPALQADPDRDLGEGVVVDPVGMVIRGLLGRHPELGRLLLEPPLLSIFEAALGTTPRLETAYGVLSDDTRPFFFWHNHLGGIDGEWYRRQGDYEPPGRIERLVCSVFYEPFDPLHGTMLIKPRALGDPARPPDRGFVGELEGCVELEAPAGTAVVFDQATLHAVRAMSGAGQRGFMGAMLVRADASPTRNLDPTVAAAVSRLPELGRFSAAIP